MAPVSQRCQWYLWRAAEMKDLPMAGEQAKKKAGAKKAVATKEIAVRRSRKRPPDQALNSEVVFS